ncbi:short-chain dehydrogenase TIC 32, chloroplastic-like isoform X1 [Canna indica]|uniref:Short-chain dehydrogenase TIC 32, chloroplastic-like isoform X1 n=1 Tax=Canna indica TaxID=4628 RepID=A0AAQ3QF71_9LILI|nr:short-chain dehydrogenase TIC 32, chloroplastic-like isoform X1 [Canna indica]
MNGSVTRGFSVFYLGGTADAAAAPFAFYPSPHQKKAKRKAVQEMLETVKYLIGSAGASGFGSKSTGEEVTAAAPDLRSVTAIITGATSGIGAETARVMVMRGARLLLPARNLKAAEETKIRIEEEFPDASIVVLPLDLSSLSSVRCFVSRFLALRLPLNLLINNAGMFSYDFSVSEDGVEMMFATNYLGPFLLTKLLLNKMVETARETGIQGRIVNITSATHTWFSGDCLSCLDLMTHKKIPYSRSQAYALSKLANVLHTKELAERLKQMDANVTANCVHPGVVPTRLNRDREGFIIVTSSSSINGRFRLLSVLQVPQNHSPGGGDDVLRSHAPAAGRGIGEVLHRLQRGRAVGGGVQPCRGRAAVARVGSHDRSLLEKPHRARSLRQGLDMTHRWRTVPTSNKKKQQKKAAAVEEGVSISREGINEYYDCLPCSPADRVYHRGEPRSWEDLWQFFLDEPSQTESFLLSWRSDPRPILHFKDRGIPHEDRSVIEFLEHHCPSTPFSFKEILQQD